MAKAIPANQFNASQTVSGNDLLSQMIQLGIDNKLLIINKVIDNIARFEPQMGKSVRGHLGFGDTAIGELRYVIVLANSLNQSILKTNLTQLI